MSGIIGKKLGMSAIYDEGRQVACTLVEAGPCVVTQLREVEKEGYSAVQLAYDPAKAKNVSQARKGHFKKAGVSPMKKVVEFRNFRADVQKGISLGQTIRVEDVFVEQEYIDTLARSKGKGFQGVVKRHGFAGVGERSHGQHNRERAPGAIGGCSFPARVFKNMRMAGQMGNTYVKVLNLKVLRIIPEQNLILLKGAVPGPKGAYVVLQK